MGCKLRRRMGYHCVVVLIAAVVTGCATTSTVTELVDHYLHLNAERCDPLGGVERESIDDVLVQPVDTDESSKTGVYVLEDGGGALAARGWLTEQAETSIDIQYFIFY